MTRATSGYLLILPRFDYLMPVTVDQACFLLREYRENAKVLAGGTDLLVSLKKREKSPRYLVSLKAVPDLDYIKYSPEEGLRIGARTTLQTIADSPVVRENFGLLATGCGKIGTLQVRNMGTIGGNICTAGPSQDSTPSLLALDARLKLVNLDGERIAPIESFFVRPFQTIMKEDELLTEVQVLPLPPGTAGSYRWLTKTAATDETLVGVAAVITRAAQCVCKDIRIGLSSVAPTPMRAKQAEAILRGKKISERLIEEAAQTAAGEIQPRSRADYRRRITRLLVKQVVSEAWEKTK